MILLGLDCVIFLPPISEYDHQW